MFINLSENDAIKIGDLVKFKELYNDPFFLLVNPHYMTHVYKIIGLSHNQSFQQTFLIEMKNPALPKNSLSNKREFYNIEPKYLEKI